MARRSTKSMPRGFQLVLATLKQHALLLQTDARLPNVCALVTGGPVIGSWWAHPQNHDIFRVTGALAEHPDVLVAKLVSGKITYVDRALWSALVTIGSARERWQLESLSRAGRSLLAQVDIADVETDRQLAKPASELERFLLIYSEQFHTEAGSHSRCLESWKRWLKRTGFVPANMTPEAARELLEERMEALNHRFKGRGRLPWHV
ncbi:MAG: hypothetical protein JWO48_247 [Bryobacterales bacterium]|nr:hypothetical protein [Bryobacterales bacterium]